MKNNSLTRALFVAGVMAVAGGVAQADTYSSSYSSADTTSLGAGPSTLTTTTITTTTPVYVFPSINYDSSSVLLDPHPMMSRARRLDMDRTAAATFDSPTRAGEASTMTAGAPNQLTTNENVATVPPALVDTTSLGAGPSTMGSSWYGTSSYDLGNNNNAMNLGGQLGSNNCGSSMPCNYLPD
jgi:hypothetical protein